ncbi:cytochrome P450 [Mycena alexandri]|uniref:Cytochrome P450 n=1 Tax=Mycena alexandri TaxID=1745969 RepID=A0AAD6X417_9AGAR|nr:cytochrome P450 [Mycena alexandri]
MAAPRALVQLTNLSLSFHSLWPPTPGLATAVAVLSAVYLLLYRLQAVKNHPNEPPIVPSWFPFVGPLLGMVGEGGRHVKSIGLRNRDKPIFTLPVPRSRIYVVTDPALAAAVQRASKALSFTPLVPDLTARVLGIDSHAVEVLRQNIDEPHGFLADMHDMLYTYLGPGEPLNALSLGAARELGRQITAHAAQLKAPETVNLLAWVQHFVTTGTAQYLYGPENPLAKHPELEQAFWDFDHGLGRLLLGIVPALTARAPYQYLSAGHHETGASTIVQRRVEIAHQHGLSNAATARSELSFLFAGIVNTATTTFWAVLQVFARPELLAAVRAELPAAVVEDPATGERRLSMDLLKGACPTLHAVFRECLRVGSDNYSTRLVKSDTMLAGQWHLKAGSIVQIAGGVIHADEGIWGANADAFDPTRFLKDGESNKASEGKVHPAAFRAFGGGKTLCPGRHFATHEILAFVAVIVLTFDLETADGAMRIPVPPQEDRVLPVHVLEPRTDVLSQK